MIQTDSGPSLVTTLYGREPGSPEQLPRGRGARRVSRAAVVLRVAHHVGLFAAFVAAGLSIMLLAGAVVGCTTPVAYRSVDRSRFEAIAPEVSAYWAADPRLDDEQKARRFRLLRAWDADSAGLDERQNPVSSK